MRYQKSALFISGVLVTSSVFWLLGVDTRPLNVDRGVEPQVGRSVAGDADPQGEKERRVVGPGLTNEMPEPSGLTAAAIPTVPLPDNRLPLAQQLEALIERARHGDPVSACRLAVHTSRCRATARTLKVDSEIASGLERRETAGASDSLMTEVLAHSMERSQANARFCEGVDVDSVPDIDRIPEYGLGAMSVRQKVLMALLQPSGAFARLPKEISIPAGAGNSTERIQPQFLADHTYEFLQQGIAAADPLALEGMLMVHVPVWIPGAERAPRLAAPNPHRFALYALTMRQVYGDAALGGVAGDVLQKVIQTMTPEQLAALQTEADRETRRWKTVSAASGREPNMSADMDDVQLCLG